MGNTFVVNDGPQTAGFSRQHNEHQSSWSLDKFEAKSPKTAPAVTSGRILLSANIQPKEVSGEWGPSTVLPTRLWPILEHNHLLERKIGSMLNKYQPVLHALGKDYSIIPVNFGQQVEQAQTIMYIMVTDEESARVVHEIAGFNPMPILVAIGQIRLNISEIMLTAENSQPGIGASLAGELYPDSVGTMACFLQSVSAQKMYALTCAHVSKHQAKIQCPTKVDMQHSVAVCHEALQQYDKKISKAIQSGKPDRAQTLSDLQRNMQIARDALLEIELEFGKTVFESWKFSSNDQATVYIDVGLIEIDISRIPLELYTNKIPALGALRNVLSYKEPYSGMKVYKIGRYGQSFGTVNAYPSSHAFQVTIDGIVGREYVQTWTVLGDGPQCFNYPGDSGSLIIEVDTDDAVGLLFGGATENSGRQRDFTYFMPMSTVLETCRHGGFDLQFPQL